MLQSGSHTTGSVSRMAIESCALLVTMPLPVVSAAFPATVGYGLSQANDVRFRVRTATFVLPLLMVVFAMLNAADALTTYIGLHTGLFEGNPVMSGLMSHFGFSALIMYKLVVTVTIGYGARWLQRMQPVLATVTVLLCNLMVFSVVVSNMVQWLAIR